MAASLQPLAAQVALTPLHSPSSRQIPSQKRVPGPAPHSPLERLAHQGHEARRRHRGHFTGQRVGQLRPPLVAGCAAIQLPRIKVGPGGGGWVGGDAGAGGSGMRVGAKAVHTADNAHKRPEQQWQQRQWHWRHLAGKGAQQGRLVPTGWPGAPGAGTAPRRPASCGQTPGTEGEAGVGDRMWQESRARKHEGSYNCGKACGQK